MSINKLNKDDISDLIKLYAHYTSKDDLPLLSQTVIQDIWKEIELNPGVNYFILKMEDKIIASCILSITPSFIRGGKAYGLIEHVVVHSDYRRRGYAEKILNFTLDYAWDNGCTEVMLLSGAMLEPAHKLYEKLGFDKHKRIGFILDKPR